jgi:hypothetical protein
VGAGRAAAVGPSLHLSTQGFLLQRLTCLPPPPPLLPSSPFARSGQIWFDHVRVPRCGRARPTPAACMRRLPFLVRPHMPRPCTPASPQNLTRAHPPDGPPCPLKGTRCSTRLPRSSPAAATPAASPASASALAPWSAASPRVRNEAGAMKQGGGKGRCAGLLSVPATQQRARHSPRSNVKLPALPPPGRILIAQGAIDAMKIGLTIALRYSAARPQVCSPPAPQPAAPPWGCGARAPRACAADPCIGAAAACAP